MQVSAFDLFSIGIGPSSSHTVGPMRAARLFVERLRTAEVLEKVTRVRIELFGSLGATGRGHGSDRAVVMGLLGYDPEHIDPDVVPARMEDVQAAKEVRLGGESETGETAVTIRFVLREDLLFHKRKSLPGHPNGMRFTASSASGEALEERIYYSVGGGFVLDETHKVIAVQAASVAYPFGSGDELAAQCAEHGLCISTLMRKNENTWRNDAEIDARLDRLWDVMKGCVKRGCEREGILPGGLRVRRRAPDLLRQLRHEAEGDPLRVLDWVNLYALAVNEENAAGGRVVTAPTNGAAGIIPAVLHYYERFSPSSDIEGVRRFLLTAAAIGLIAKTNASISGAEVGCQGEVGVACAMAAAGLCEVLGGTPAQVEAAAEIGLEHNLGLTCDPVGGLVQVPCIERNAMGAVKAINAARLALRGTGQQKVSLDQVIETMRQTGADMKTKYKETARGGLAVHIIEC
ncbi:MAG: L-serine dehydratase [Polyangiales bacterium]|jgi:L-serine dehydratase